MEELINKFVVTYRKLHHFSIYVFKSRELKSGTKNQIVEFDSSKINLSKLICRVYEIPFDEYGNLNLIKD
ncbi:hypothetical protein BpHYR1_005243 [Brachionus plicatilis]|uniref:Uncharacterized protein n=1 Tax=Brachionus plicatilis TaxID=10195 RepID=A0A3M7SJQ4_BRAPC|nr:hypothetical protein BpHYR1_005243 [Brachionus plicatilis]